MAKQHKIRWTQSDQDELVKVVRNFNAKLKRISNKNPEMKNALPDKVTVKQLKELVNTRKDLNRELNALRRFSKRGAEQLVDVPDNYYNLQITKWQKTEMNRRVSAINRRRKNRLEMIQNIEQKSRGESLGYTKGQVGMGKAEEISLSPMNAFTRKMTRYDLKMKWDSIQNESRSDYFNERDYLLRENFLKTLRENYNEVDIEDVLNKIEGMDIKDFLQQFYEDPGEFEFAYPPDEEQYKTYVSRMKATWTPSIKEAAPVKKTKAKRKKKTK